MSYICVMKPIKKYNKGGGPVSQRSLYQTRKNEEEMKKKLKELEAQISAAKGTSRAKPLVEEYRRLTGQKK